MANVEHPYDYRRAVLKEMAAPSSMAATPNVAEATRQFAAGQGRAAAESQAMKSDLAFGEKKLAEQDRQFMAKLDMDRQMLDTWGEQNKWATAIAVANLGVQALGIPANQKTIERQEGILKGYAEEGLKRIAMTNDATEKAIAAAEKQRLIDAARHDSALDLIKARNLVGDPEITAELANLQNLTTEGTMALRAADRPYFPVISTPDIDLSAITRKRLPH